MTDKEKIREEVERLRNLHQMKYQQLDADSSMSLVECGKRNLCNELLSFIDSLQEEPVSKDLKEASYDYVKSNHKDISSIDDCALLYDAIEFGSKWQKAHLWKDAQGGDLPEIDREVVVFTQNFPNDAGIMCVAIAHRPNPDGWDGKSLSTGKVEHYTPKTYDKGGWNIPDVKYWLDVELPKEMEE